jgi:hypothetical protein
LTTPQDLACRGTESTKSSRPAGSCSGGSGGGIPGRSGRTRGGPSQVHVVTVNVSSYLSGQGERTLSTAISPSVTTITLRPGSLDHHVTTYAPTPPANMPLPRNDAELEADIDTTTTSASSDHQSLAHGIAPSVRGGGAESGIHAGCAVEERGVAAGSKRRRGCEVC